MSEPFIGELKLVGFNFAPRGWARCEGQLLPISQYTALFSLIGTRYGGNGQTTFALPDLRGRVAAHVGLGLNLAQQVGVERVTLTTQELPSHRHGAKGSGAAASAQLVAGATHAVVQAGVVGERYGPPTDLVAMAGQHLATAGTSQAHENRQPFLAMYWVIALTGIYPSQP